MQLQNKGFLFAIVAAMCYGLNPLFALPLYGEGLTPMSVLVYRYASASLLMSMLMLYEHHSFRLTLKEGCLTAVMGSMLSISSILLFYSFQYMDAGIASTILFTYPIIVALLSWLFFNIKVGTKMFISLVLAIIGILFLYKGEDGAVLDSFGVLLVMGSSLTYALYLLGANRSVLSCMPGVKLSFYATLFGAILIIAVSLMSVGIQPITSTSMFLNALGLALFPTLISVVLITRAIQIIGSTPTAIIGALEPLTALAVSLLFFDGYLTPLNTVGVLLILFAVILVVWRRKK